MKSLSLLVAALAACGGDSSNGGGDDVQILDASTAVAASTKLDDLTSAQITAECKSLTYMYPSKDVDCGNGTVSVGFVSQSNCVASFTGVAGSHPDCQATVGDVEMCASIEYNSGTGVCNQTELPISCARIASADCGGTSN